MKRLRIILVVLAALLVGVVIICLVQPKEPSYQGRKLSEWLSDYGEAGWNWDSFHNIEATQQAAERAVKEIGNKRHPNSFAMATSQKILRCKTDWMLSF